MNKCDVWGVIVFLATLAVILVYMWLLVNYTVLVSYLTIGTLVITLAAVIGLAVRDICKTA